MNVIVLDLRTLSHGRTTAELTGAATTLVTDAIDAMFPRRVALEAVDPGWRCNLALAFLVNSGINWVLRPDDSVSTTSIALLALRQDALTGIHTLSRTVPATAAPSTGAGADAGSGTSAERRLSTQPRCTAAEAVSALLDDVDAYIESVFSSGAGPSVGANVSAQSCALSTAGVEILLLSPLLCLPSGATASATASAAATAGTAVSTEFFTDSSPEELVELLATRSAPEPQRPPPPRLTFLHAVPETLAPGSETAAALGALATALAPAFSLSLGLVRLGFGEVAARIAALDRDPSVRTLRLLFPGPAPAPAPAPGPGPHDALLSGSEGGNAATATTAAAADAGLHIDCTLSPAGIAPAPAVAEAALCACHNLALLSAAPHAGSGQRVCAATGKRARIAEAVQGVTIGTLAASAALAAAPAAAVAAAAATGHWVSEAHGTAAGAPPLLSFDVDLAEFTSLASSSQQQQLAHQEQNSFQWAARGAVSAPPPLPPAPAAASARVIARLPRALVPTVFLGSPVMAVSGVSASARRGTRAAAAAAAAAASQVSARARLAAREAIVSEGGRLLVPPAALGAGGALTAAGAAPAMGIGVVPVTPFGNGISGKGSAFALFSHQSRPSHPPTTPGHVSVPLPLGYSAPSEADAAAAAAAAASQGSWDAWHAGALRAIFSEICAGEQALVLESESLGALIAAHARGSGALRDRLPAGCAGSMAAAAAWVPPAAAGLGRDAVVSQRYLLVCTEDEGYIRPLIEGWQLRAMSSAPAHSLPAPELAAVQSALAAVPTHEDITTLLVDCADRDPSFSPPSNQGGGDGGVGIPPRGQLCAAVTALQRLLPYQTAAASSGAVNGSGGHGVGAGAWQLPPRGRGLLPPAAPARTPHLPSAGAGANVEVLPKAGQAASAGASKGGVRGSLNTGGGAQSQRTVSAAAGASGWAPTAVRLAGTSAALTPAAAAAAAAAPAVAASATAGSSATREASAARSGAGAESSSGHESGSGTGSSIYARAKRTAPDAPPPAASDSALKHVRSVEDSAGQDENMPAEAETAAQRRLSQPPGRRSAPGSAASAASVGPLSQFSSFDAGLLDDKQF